MKISSFNGSLDQAAVEGSPDGLYTGTVDGHDAPAGCYSLYGTVTITVGSDSVTGQVVESASSVCPTGAPDEYSLNMTLDVTSGTGAWTNADGTLTFEGTQSARDSASVRTSTGDFTETITS